MWTMLSLGIEMYKILRFIHEKKYLHRDIKPGNFCVGQDEFSDHVYMVDYGLSKRYIHESSGMHIPMNISETFVGSLRYCSVACSDGKTTSRRDDCESVYYMLVEMAKGDLPWSKNI